MVLIFHMEPSNVELIINPSPGTAHPTKMHEDEKNFLADAPSAGYGFTPSANKEHVLQYSRKSR